MSHADDNEGSHEGTRRDFLYYATAGAGAVTVGALSAGYTAIDIAQPLTWSLITVDLLSIFTVVSFWIGSVYYERDKHLIIK